MIKLWFLMALMVFPNSPAIEYKGFAAYYTLKVCEEKKISLENLIVETNLALGKSVMHVDTFCMEMYAFPSQLDKYKELEEKKVPIKPLSASLEHGLNYKRLPKL